MDNQQMLCRTIRFQRTALQNSMAIISAVQQNGENLLKTTLEQSPWIPGNSKKACLFWAGIWTKSLTGMTDLIDRNLAEMERLTSAGNRTTAEEKLQEKTAVKPQEPLPRTVAVKKAFAEKKTPAGRPHQAAEKQRLPTRPAVEQVAMVKTIVPKAPVPNQPPVRQPIAEKPQTAIKEMTPTKPAVEQVAMVKTTIAKAPVPNQPPAKQLIEKEKLNEMKTTAEKPQAAVKEMTPTKSAVEQVAMVKTAIPKAPVTNQPPAKQPIEKEKSTEIKT
jgi:hypothetical protein